MNILALRHADGQSVTIASKFNLAMVLGVSTLFMIKSVVEENFLKSDPMYALHMQQVRSRWFPGIA